MAMRFRNLLWTLIACVAAAAGSPTLATPRSVDIVLAAGKVHEDCFRLGTEQRIRYGFSTDRPSEFSLHYHKGKDVFYPIRSEHVSEQKGDFVAAVAEEYCLMWTGGKGGDAAACEFIVHAGPSKYDARIRAATAAVIYRGLRAI
jgi:hypothetical protein